VTLDTCGATYDTVLAVYSYTGSGGFAGLTPVTSNDNTTVCGSGTDSYVTFNAVAGTEYRIAVDGKGTQTGFATLNVQPPANDSFASGVPLTGALPISATGTATAASTQLGEPPIAGKSPFSSVWYTWTAPYNGTATVDTCSTTPPAGGVFVSDVGVFTGTAVNALTSVVGAATTGCANSTSTFFPASATFTATAGTTYQIAVDARGPPFTLTVNEARAIYSLLVAKHGAGTVTSSPTGISCGSSCAHTFASGTIVTLTAKAAFGSRFAGWSGACTGTKKCAVTMSAAKRVTATFTIIPPPDTTITGKNISSAARKAIFDFAGSGGVGALHFRCKLDSGGWQTCTSPKTYTRLSHRSHTLQVEAIDSRGKADPTPAKFTFTI
jgi:hypothetical protein